MKKVLMQVALVLSVCTACAGIQQDRPVLGAICVPDPGSTALESGCVAAPRQPMNLDAFKAVANQYSSLQPKAASRFLISTNRQDAGLAETLMLYQRRLQQPADVEAAFLFYVINTSDPSLADEDPDVLRRLEQNYRKSLLLAEGPVAESGQSMTLEELRSFGQQANESRYGRGDVIPTALLGFDESSAGYSHLNAVWMAEVAALAYWDKELVDSQLRLWQYELVAEIADADTETTAYLAEKDGHMVLSFRGTSSLKDFKTDARILKTSTDWADGKVHRGFAGALDSVWPDITDLLGEPGQQQKELWVTGHSLGAALAQLAALRLKKLGYEVRAVYTYGTPRIGNKAFVADYDRVVGDRTFPHINRNDLVTRVPLAALGYRTSAKKQVRKFTGLGHAMKPLKQSPDKAQATDVSSAVSSIRRTTDFLPDSLRSSDLRTAVPGSSPDTGFMNLYSNEFESGPLDEHGSFEYLFKLGCVALEKDLWRVEASRAGMKVGRLDFQRNEGQ